MPSINNVLIVRDWRSLVAKLMDRRMRKVKKTLLFI